MSASERPPGAPQAGDVLAGKYRVERVLGLGGMGVVVAAHHIQLDQRVALKFLLPAALEDPVAVARFVREARTAVKITSEHVARVSDVGELDTGAPYMVMEYLEGGDLDAWLRDRGALSVEQAVEFLLQTCVAVADAHALGIVHRDLKPANLFCVTRSDGQLSIKVLDFGISKVTNLGATMDAMSMTKTSAVMGTPLYMSPEQMNSAKEVDARSDIWALGVILYELLTGSAPFVADSVMQLAVNIATQSPPSLQEVRPDVPPGLEAVIVKCLEKKPENRYADVGELAMALAIFAPGRARASVDRIFGIVHSSKASVRSASMIPPRRAEGTFVAAATIPGIARTTSGSRRVRSLWIGSGLLGILVIVAVLRGKLDVRNEATSATPGRLSSSMAASATSALTPPSTDTVIPGPSSTLPGRALVDPPTSTPIGSDVPRVTTSVATAATTSRAAPRGTRPPAPAVSSTTVAAAPVTPVTPAKPVDPLDPLSKLQLKK